MTAEEIKKIRERLGLTQEQFAPLVHANRVTVARWETGVSKPRGVYVAILREFEEKAKTPKRKKGR
jgi:DNA-binding transcriptional regulator YiaG